MMTRPSGFLQNLMKPFKSQPNKDKEEDLEKIASQEQKHFSLETLVAATRDFHSDHKLGEGGFGPVYKGKLGDGREIAVKRLSHSSNQGKKEFMNEAKLLAKVQHRNVVNLLGYCAQGPEKLLVYEYIVNESLDKLLFNAGRRAELDWKRRYDVIAGVARGLLYLHEDSHSVIIHRDIKASNILLDDKWFPKIADFGMARLFPEDQTHINTRVAGTNGYMAPEYVMHGQLSVKADVFSYGVVVLELISGQKNSTFNLDPDSHNLLEWVWKLYKKGRSLEIMDPTLASTAVTEHVAMCIQIGLLCTQADPKLRPTMRRVVVMLSKRPGTLEEPTRPGYPGSRYRRTHRPHATSSSAAGSSGSGGSFGDSSASNTFATTSTTKTITTSTLPSPRPHSPGTLEDPIRLDYPGSRHRRTHRPHASSSSTAGSSGAGGSFGDSSLYANIETATTSTNTNPRPHSHGTLEEPTRLDYPGSRHRRTHRPHASSSSAAGSSGANGSSRDSSLYANIETATTSTLTNPKPHSQGTLEEPTRLDYPGSRHRRTHKPHASSSLAAGSSSAGGSSGDSSLYANIETVTTSTLTNSRPHSYGKRPMQG